MNAKNGQLVIVAAPSGGGKTSVINRLMARHADMVHSVSCTTRKMRPDEKDGEYYFHVSRRAFEDGIAAGRFAEWAEVHGNFYGTPKEPLDGWLAQGKTVLLDLDVVGSLNLKKNYGSRAVTIFLVPPSMEELKKRLSGRGTDSRETQELRLKNAIAELSRGGEFDHQVVNDDLERACTEIEKIIL